MTDGFSCLPPCGSQRGGSGERSGELCRRVVDYLELYPGQTFSWRVERNSEVRACASWVRVTTHSVPYDYRLEPGAVLRMARGERIWISSEGERKVGIEVSTDQSRRREGRLIQWLFVLSAALGDLSLLRARC